MKGTGYKHATFILPIELIEKLSKFTKNKSSFVRTLIEKKIEILEKEDKEKKLYQQRTKALNTLKKIRKNNKVDKNFLVNFQRKDRDSH